MICLPAHLPLLSVGCCEYPRYEAGWIEQSISRAAEEAGHTQWMFAEDIAKGVIAYLKERFEGTSITLADLAAKIVNTLDAVGFPDIAARLHVDPPPVDVSLAALADEAGSAFELLFFHLLDARISELHASGVTRIRFVGLEECVSTLGGTEPEEQRSSGRKRGSRRQRAQVCSEDDIRAFLEARTQQWGSAPSASMSFVLA